MGLNSYPLLTRNLVFTGRDGERPRTVEPPHPGPRKASLSDADHRLPGCEAAQYVGSLRRTA
ncbi:hypothetical protein GCM10010245_32250 [Streptomyces spectabilis]|nr:hypothetical protein GCM10010245_32250 [Streptomyces spectabilis]